MASNDDSLSDEDFLVARVKEAQKENMHNAKSWMVTAKTLFPTNFKTQFEAYLMEKQSGNVREAAECFSSLMLSRENMATLLPEISAIAHALRYGEVSFLGQMFNNINPDIQLTILKSCIENSDDTLVKCKLIVLMLKKFPQRGVDSIIKTLINDDKLFYDDQYTRLLVVEIIPLLSSLDSPRLLERLLVKAIDFYNSYLYDDTDYEITEPWRRLYGVLELLGRQLGWDSFLLNYNNSSNKEVYFQKLLSLKNAEDFRQLLYCGTTFFLRALHDQKSLKGNLVLVEALTDPELPPSECRKGDIEITGLPAIHFQMAASCWELLHSNEVMSREFTQLTNQLLVKPWLEGSSNEIAMYRGRYDEVSLTGAENSLSGHVVRVSINYHQKNYPVCIESILAAIPHLPNTEGALDSELIVGGKHRHFHFLPVTKMAIMHYFCTLLIRILQNSGNTSDVTYGHILVLMQLGWPQEESVFLHILDVIKEKRAFHYPTFFNYVIHIDILEEFSFMGKQDNIVLDILPSNQQLIGQRRIGSRGAKKGVKDDFKQAMKAQVARCNESILNIMIQFITAERSYFNQIMFVD